MSAQHTPGPWAITVRDKHEGDCAPGLWIMGEHNTVVDTGNLAVWPLSEANARLIAAAPELLSALKVLVSCWNCDSNGQWYAEEVGAARAAIAKAEGNAT